MDKDKPETENDRDLAAALDAIRADLRDEYLQPHERPWLVGFSGGKDSTLLLQLVLDMLLDLPASKRRRQIHVLSNDTLVESPVLQTFVDSLLERLKQAVADLSIPVTVVKTSPDPDNTFWVNLIGRGYPAPYRLFRWCTDRMKIRPTTAYIHRQVSAAGEVILLLGVRRSESAARARVVKRYDNGTRLNPHNDVKGCLVYRPIVDLTTEEVWTALMQLRPPWGGTHHKLVTLYRNAAGGECPFVVDSNDAPSCGTNSSRFGCWTCTVVEKDRSLQNFIDNGYEHLEPLAEFRDRLRALSEDRSLRMQERRNGQEGIGPFTLAARRQILDELLEVQRAVELPLISSAEIKRIEEIWREDEYRISIHKANRLLALIGEP